MSTSPLPKEYGTSRLVGLVRDPRTLFYYWEVAPSERPGTADDALVFRLTDTSTEGPSLDIPVRGWTGSVYVPVEPNRLFDSALAVRGADGSLVEILRGPRLRSPRETPAGNEPAFFERREGRWIEVPSPWAVLSEEPVWEGAQGSPRAGSYPSGDGPRSLRVPTYPYAPLAGR